MSLYWYEHGYLRQLYPDAGDDVIAGLVADYVAECARRVAVRADPPPLLIPVPASPAASTVGHTRRT